MTDQQIDDVFAAMPGGAQGFCRDFGYRQFARAVLAASGIHRENADEQWRQIVARATASANRYGLQGMAVTCVPSRTGTMLTWTVKEVVKAGDALGAG